MDSLSPTEIEWIKGLVRSDGEGKLKAEDEELKQAGLIQEQRIPTTKIEEILVELYDRLDGSPSPDKLDQFYTEKVAGYKDKLKLCRVLEDFGALPRRRPKSEQEWANHFTKFFIKLGENAEGIRGRVKQAVNKKYPNLIVDNPIDSEEVTELHEKNRELLTQQVANIGEEIRKNRERYKHFIGQIKKAQKTQVDGLAEKLNKTILLGIDNWKLIIYSIVSPSCPSINITGLRFRSNIHIGVVGDISTAKSTIADIITQISPKAITYTGFTKASFEGIYDHTTGGMNDGIIDEVRDGMLVIKEYTPNMLPFEREFYDNTEIILGKGKAKKRVIPNTTLFVCSNPKDDFFQQELLRPQINFKEGVLSRWDFMLPLMHTKEYGAKIIDNMDLFSEETTDHEFSEIAQALRLLVKGIGEFRGIRVTQEQKQKLKHTYYLHNIELPHRPLEIPRDIQILCRFVNVVVCCNFFHREAKDGLLVAKDEDVDEAISLYEHMLHLRKAVYECKVRKVESIEDLIYRRIALSGKDGILKVGLRSDICAVDIEGNSIKDSEGVLRGMCSPSTFYRKIKSLKFEKRVIEKQTANNGGIKLYAVG